MSDAETPSPATEAAEATPAPPPKPAPPVRVLPTQEELADWFDGADCASIDNLFNNLVIMRFDVLVMQIRKEELVPQHWQILETAEVDEEVFDRLPEIGALRVHYRNQELSRVRIEAVRVAWRELRGKRPNLWAVADLLAAMRRIIEKKHEIDFHDLLSAVRDIWANMTIPFGQEQREILWAVLSFVRNKTKK